MCIFADQAEPRRPTGAFDGTEVSSPTDLQAGVDRKRPGDRVELTILRDGREQTVAMTPVMIEGAPKIGAVINPFEVRTMEPGPVEAMRLSVVFPDAGLKFYLDATPQAPGLVVVVGVLLGSTAFDSFTSTTCMGSQVATELHATGRSCTRMFGPEASVKS